MPAPRVGVIRTGTTAYTPVSKEPAAAQEALDSFVNQLRDLGFGKGAAETAVSDVAKGAKTPTQAATSVTPKKTGTGGNRAKIKKPSAVKKAAAKVLRKVGKALQGKKKNS